MYHSNFHTKMITFNILNQLDHIPLKALVAQWVHPLNLTPQGVYPCCDLRLSMAFDGLNFLFLF